MKILASPSPRMLLHLKDQLTTGKAGWKSQKQNMDVQDTSLGSLIPSQNVSEGLRGDGPWGPGRTEAAPMFEMDGDWVSQREKKEGKH